MRPLSFVREEYPLPPLHTPDALDAPQTPPGDTHPLSVAETADMSSATAAARHVFHQPTAVSDLAPEPGGEQAAAASDAAPAPRVYTDAEKRDVLRSLGVSDKHLKKTKGAKLDAAFGQALAALQSPGKHKVTLKLDKKYELKVKVGADGTIESAQAKEKKGFLAKLGGALKMVAPIVGMVLAPVTGGLSLVATAALGAADAIKNKNWLGAIASVAGAFVPAAGSVMSKVVSKAVTTVAGVVQKGAYAVQGALAAIKGKSIGALVGAVAAGVGAAAGVAGTAGTRLAEFGAKLGKYAGFVAGGEAAVRAARSGDILGAAASGMSVAAGATRGTTAERLTRVSGWMETATARDVVGCGEECPFEKNLARRKHFVVAADNLYIGT